VQCRRAAPAQALRIDYNEAVAARMSPPRSAPNRTVPGGRVHRAPAVDCSDRSEAADLKQRTMPKRCSSASRCSIWKPERISHAGQRARAEAARAAEQAARARLGMGLLHGLPIPLRSSIDSQAPLRRQWDGGIA